MPGTDPVWWTGVRCRWPLQMLARVGDAVELDCDFGIKICGTVTVLDARDGDNPLERTATIAVTGFRGPLPPQLSEVVVRDDWVMWNPG